jgi:two-component system, OmpR family, phosphate regulon sensor histidine kinase PhoR
MDTTQRYEDQSQLAAGTTYNQGYQNAQSAHHTQSFQRQRSRGKQLFLNILYLLAALPLGVTYFCVVVIAISLLPLSLLIIGIPVTALFLYTLWELAVFERYITRAWLQIDIPPMYPTGSVNLNWAQRLLAHLSRAITWKSLCYLFLKFPLGIIMFNLTIVLLVLTLVCYIGFFLAFAFIGPFIYLFRVFFPNNDIEEVEYKKSISILKLGNELAKQPLYLVNYIATLYGQFARTMLGMSDQAMRLALAEQLAEQEHAKAERAEQSRRELIINASHELRTPVASIRGHIESLMIACEESENAVPEPETLQKYLTIVHRESLRLGSLVDDILSVARAETNELRVSITAVEASEVVEEVYQTLAPLAKRERQILLIREIEPHLPQVQADRQRLVQVLLNLVRNAITYTPDGGIVSITLHRENNAHVALLVSDTGIGIPPEDRQRIFERFYRTDASRARTSGGFGLGLAIVRDFVQAMGGSIAVKSAVGEGSTFRVLLRVV